MACHKCTGPGYASPADAQRGPREKVLFVTAPHAQDGPDAIFSVDVDPDSSKYCQVISRVDVPNIGDEVHHTGWNACSSCHDKPSERRSHLIVPCLNSDRIYIINVEDENKIFLEKTIEPEILHSNNLSFPHTSHCLADGNIMISTLGTKDGSPSGNFALFDGKSFDFVGTWPAGDPVAFNYDFWYQPRRNVMISTEWGSPKHIKHGFDPKHIGEGLYGHSVHVFEWDSHKKLETIQLPMPEGALPLEVRFPHDPNNDNAFVGCALGSSIFRIHPNPADPSSRIASNVASIPNKKVDGWVLPEMPALITDILISMDDKYLYVSCWLHGDIRQYDITDPSHPVLVGQIYIGGSIHNESGITVTDEGWSPIEALYVKGRKIEGGPQMLQLSLDGRRLYVTTSLYKKWDEQFYPKHADSGATMLQIDVCPETGNLSINPNFLIDFGKVKGGPYLAHEMRYPGGDCTSDIWI